MRPLAAGKEFVAYVDAVGRLDGRACLLEWKTTSSRYSEEPEGLLALDPQLLCYSWMTGIHDVAQWYSCASDWSKSSIYAPRSPTNSARSSVNWCTRLFIRSSPRVSPAQRHPLSPEPVQHLPLRGAMSGESTADRRPTNPAARSTGLWPA